jgi:hypothetical protein
VCELSWLVGQKRRGGDDHDDECPCNNLCRQNLQDLTLSLSKVYFQAAHEDTRSAVAVRTCWKLENLHMLVSTQQCRSWTGRPSRSCEGSCCRQRQQTAAAESQSKVKGTTNMRSRLLCNHANKSSHSSSDRQPTLAECFAITRSHIPRTPYLQPRAESYRSHTQSSRFH